MSTLRNARFATLLAVALVLVITGAVSGAAGQALILGQSNSAGASQTKLTASLSAPALRVVQNGSGSPLSLIGPTNQPPMTVNSKAKVENLNADHVDGKSAGQFLPSAVYRQQSATISIPAGDAYTFNLYCDTGDHVLSGGYHHKHSATNAFDSTPVAGGTGWDFYFQNLGASPDTLWAFILCADFAPLHGG